MSSDIEIKGIQETIQAYLDAIKTGDEKHFRRAFYSFAYIIPSDENPVKSKTHLKNFMRNVQGRHNMGIQSEEKALGTTYSYSGKAANVKMDFKLLIGDETLYGTDYFNLVKYNGVWKITQKIYSINK
jgi:hypothetical protein